MQASPSCQPQARYQASTGYCRWKDFIRLLSLLLASGMHQKLLYSNEGSKVRPFSPLRNSTGWRQWYVNFLMLFINIESFVRITVWKVLLQLDLETL